MDYQDIVAAELIAHNITLCTGCEDAGSHARGYALPDAREIHYSAKMATRATLHGFLHEVGHIIKGHGKASKLKRWEQELEAEEYATTSMRIYGISVPRKTQTRGSSYVARMKRWGRNIAAGRRRA